MIKTLIFFQMKNHKKVYFKGDYMNNKKLLISVYECIGESSAISTEEGDSLYQRIEKALDKEISVQVSFKNIQLITTAFLNAAIGQLYKKYTSDQLNEKLEILDLEPTDMEILKRVISVAKKYFENPEEVEKSIDEELGNDH